MAPAFLPPSLDLSPTWWPSCLTSWVFSYSEGFPGLQERTCTFKLEKEMGQGQDAAADHGDSPHQAGIDQDEVALQGLWEDRRQDKLHQAEPSPPGLGAERPPQP